MEKPVSLLLTPEKIHAHCLFAIQQARNTSHALASLIALQSFITVTAQPSDLNTPELGVIKGIINGHIATLRTELFAEQTRALSTALCATDCAAITRIHVDSSRNGFWQATQAAAQQWNEAERTRISSWALAWHNEAKSRALAASGYPDALNFLKAGISPQEYAAMTDINHCLQDTQ
jgi:hypothetical protein